MPVAKVQAQVFLGWRKKNKLILCYVRSEPVVPASSGTHLVPHEQGSEPPKGALLTFLEQLSFRLLPPLIKLKNLVAPTTHTN